MSFVLTKKNKIIVGSSALIILLLAASLFILPKFIGRYVIKEQLIQMGLAFEGIETLNIDLWNSEVSFGPVQIGMDLGKNPIILQEMALQYDLSETFNKRILFNKVIFNNLDIRFDRSADGSFAINGISLQTFLPQSDEADVEVSDEAPWHAGIDQFSLRDSRVYYENVKGENAEFQIKNMDLSSFRTWEPETIGKFNIEGKLNEIGVTMEGIAQLFSDHVKINVKERFSEIGVTKIERVIGPLGFDKKLGIVNVELDHVIDIFPEGDIKLLTNGKLSVVDLSLTHATGFQGDWAKGEIVFSNLLELDPQRKGHASGNFQIIGEDFDMTKEGVALLSAKTLSLKGENVYGRIDFELTPSFKGDFTIEGDGVVAQLAGLVDTKSAQFGLQLNDLNVDLSDPLIAKTKGDITLVDFTTTLPKNENRPAINTLLNGLDLSFVMNANVPAEATPSWDGQLTGEISGIEMSIANGDALKMTIAKAELTDLVADSSVALAGDAVLLTQINMVVTDKLIYGLDAGSSEAKSVDNENKGDKIQGLKLPFAFRLNRFAIVDGAQIEILDASVTPDVESQVKITEFELTNFDSLDQDKLVEIDIKALINEFANLSVSGKAKVFSEQPVLDVLLDLKGLQLHPVSPYAAKHAGMYLSNGRLSMQAIGSTKEGRLESEVKLDIMSLEFEPVSADDRERLSAATGVPIDTAVGLLEDTDGRIMLTIPIAGDLSNPEVNLDQIINKAIGGAIQTAAATAFKILFPPALLISLFEESENGKVAFKPIEFDAGATDENAAGKVNVDALAQLMNERPKLTITLCGRATQPDFAMQFEKLRIQRTNEILAMKKEEAEAAAEAAQIAAVAAGTPISETIAPVEVGPIILSGEELVELREKARNENANLADKRTLSIKRKLVGEYSIDPLRVNECRATEDPNAQQAPHVAVNL